MMTEAAIQTESTAAPRKVKVWQRPALPERYRGSGLAMGVMLFVGAVLLAAMPFLYAGDVSYSGYGVMVLMAFWWPLAGTAFLLSMWVTSVSLILREIRLQAFEAAIRGGDLVEIDPKEKGWL